MTTTTTCPQCGAALPPEAPAGLCPRCLLQAGLASQSQAAGDSPAAQPTTDQPEGRRFVPLMPGELAPAFPQLEILELLGSGGMGAVYKARQPHLDRLVALKILPPQLAQDPAFEERFSREARALAKLNHPHIVTVYDFGETSTPANGEPEASATGKLYYLVMEYVDGTNLRRVIQQGSLKPEEALAIVPQICEALQYAHDRGVVHRDIKPENILLDRQGRVKIADFGLAKMAGQPPAGEAAAVGKAWTLTATGQVMGTPHYMAPEQLRGTHEVDHRADIYSLGVVFYEMLTSELPIGKFEPPSRKIQVDVRLDEVVLRALESNPERRYQQASEVKTDVETISREHGQAAQRLAGAATSSVTDGNPVTTLARRAASLYRAVLIFNLVISLVAAWGFYREASFSYNRGIVESIMRTSSPRPVVVWTAGVALSLAFYFVAWQWMGLPPHYPGRERDFQLGFRQRFLQTLPGATSIICSLGMVVCSLGWAFVASENTRFRYSALDSDVGFGVAAIFALLGLFAFLSVCSVRVPRCSDGLITIAGFLTVVLTSVYVLHNWGGPFPGGKDNPARCWSSADCWPAEGTTVTVSLGIGPLCALLLGLSLLLAPTAASMLPRILRRNAQRNEATARGSAPAGLSSAPTTAVPSSEQFRLLLACAIGMVLGGLMMAAGVAVGVYALLTVPIGSGGFWGWMGGALGCFLGGGGSLLGSWNSFRQLAGAGDLLRAPGRTWLDYLMWTYTLTGMGLAAAALAVFFQVAAITPTVQALLTLGGMMVFQGILFLVFRGLMRQPKEKQGP